MAVKVCFEIGHTAKLKSKKTPEGFTHDWELYVRGTDKSDISHFVDKVVFNLHDSFPKPKRTYKEAPYVLKESGYAGFVLPIDIYFKNRDDPKRVIYQYDLDLQTTGPPVHRSVVKKFVFNNPSEEFKQKLLKGGGTILMMNYDEKSRDSTDERSQTGIKSKSSNDPVKKNKVRPEDSKMQTFATLFGTPITKTSTKVSPDPKNKGSPNLLPNNKGNNKIMNEKSTSISSSGSGKEKNEKIDKKDKHRRNSPHRERDSSKDNRKISKEEEKHDRKEEKSKEKSHSKDRDRSKDRTLKRPASPKRMPSPKRPSPSRSSSTSNRMEESISKQTKSDSDNKKTSSNSGKKSKKDKKSHEKDKDRERKERDRERKDKDDRSNSSSASLTTVPSNLSHSSGTQIKSNVDTKIDTGKKPDSTQLKDAKEIKKSESKIQENSNSEKKSVEKQDKDTEKKHKHKKKEKSKEKDKEKELSLKEKKKEKNSKQIDIKKISQPSPQRDSSIVSGQQKNTSSSTTVNNPKLSDQDSSDSESENVGPTTTSDSKANNNHSDTSNSSFPDLMTQKPTVSQHFEDTKQEKKDHKSREKLKTEKNGKKRKRKSKDDQEQQPVRKSVSPLVNTQTEPPPNKQFKKEDFKTDNSKISSPALISSSQTMANEASPRIGNNSPVFRTPSSTSVPVALSTTNSNDKNTINVDYMSELRELQHKIMTLQDNNELQQVVEMIAATGRFEVTSKTFDFDLCALDRTTVQRLQDFLATTVS